MVAKHRKELAPAKRAMMTDPTLFFSFWQKWCWRLTGENWRRLAQEVPPLDMGAPVVYGAPPPRRGPPHKNMLRLALPGSKGGHRTGASSAPQAFPPRRLQRKIKKTTGENWRRLAETSIPCGFLYGQTGTLPDWSSATGAKKMQAHLVVDTRKSRISPAAAPGSIHTQARGSASHPFKAADARTSPSGAC
jgi:hypothetical protein